MGKENRRFRWNRGRFLILSLDLAAGSKEKYEGSVGEETVEISCDWLIVCSMIELI